MSGSSVSLADQCRDFATHQLEELVSVWAPDLALPRLFAGHVVGSDCAADLAHAMTLLARAGVQHVAQTPIRDGVARALQRVVGRDTATFWSYRVAESLLLFGEGSDNELLRACPPAVRAHLEAACDTTAVLPRLGRDVPTNYCFVIARAEAARHRLGLCDRSNLDIALAAARAALDANVYGFIDDSQHGHGRFDLYLADALLISEPLAPLLGDSWDRRLEDAARLCRLLASRTGELIPWGRSTGVLSVAATVHFAATAISRGIEPLVWTGLGSNALASLSTWFDTGIVTAPRRAGQDRYRRESRWLQLTLDVIGKVAAAGLLAGAAVPADPTTLEPSPDEPALFVDHDELVRLGDRTAVWSYRRGTFAFSVPFVAGPSAGYLAVPNQPGLFEVPADSELAMMTPIAIQGGGQFVSRGRPTFVRRNSDGAVEAEWSGFKRLGDGDTSDFVNRIGGRRSAVFHVDGRTIKVEETLRFDEPPAAIAIQALETVTNAADLLVEHNDDLRQARRLDVTGAAAYRTHGGSPIALHHVEIEQPGECLDLRWQLTGRVRVAVTSRNHWYVDTIYRHLAGRVVGVAEDFRGGSMESADVFHLHWPERIAGRDIDGAAQITAALRRSRTPIVWTMHNLQPHERRDGDDALYEHWAAAATGVIHHSEWGMARARGRYRFADGCIHRVIRHPHFAHLGPANTTGRTASLGGRLDAERRLGLPPCALRIGVVGSPRPHRSLQPLVDAVLSSRRPDVQLVVFSAPDNRSLPRDPRIVAFPHEFVTRAAFNLRLASLDAIALAFFDDDALGTGILADAIGHRLPVLTPQWGFAAEVLDGAQVPIGGSAAEIAPVIDNLTPETLAAAASQMERLIVRDDPGRAAQMHADLFDEIAAR